ncbi:methyl-accepting chemotaxis protein [Paenibacillus phyllosphaerae]|uniref:Methyl-accepting chemotaxis protein n=1 Tax=Paenibacillus phyllosphaerae TaxID=274593 RepID=A0A7W5AVY5_9BACL|nr:methyl-accepting chemotaxis protein [Paenibacillus phyllosphaerae]MBB3109815.1 methyl-accepting chemotaxis protein [Paenibacillus phyllosphaerae]
MKLTVKNRLLVSFGFVLLLLVLIGSYAIYSLNKVNEQSTVISEEWLPGVNAANALNTMTSDFRNLEYRHIISGDQQTLANLLKEVDIQKAAIQDMMHQYETTIRIEEDREKFNTFKTDWLSYEKISGEVLGLSTQMKNAAAIERMESDSKALFDKVSNELLNIVTYNQSHADEASKLGDDVYANTRTILIVVIVLAVIITLVVSMLIINSIIRPLRTLTEAADRLAVGDVSANVKATSQDEIGMLMEAFAAMITNIREQAQTAERIAAGDLTVNVHVRSEQDLLGRKLQELVRNMNDVMAGISSSAEQVASGSSQVSASSIALSQGATEQASAVEELSASLEEISSQTNLNAQNAGNANELAETLKANAVNGNQQMQNMLSAMEQINDASASISKIIKVIDEIAFQTNILALNAAVEAARAGQHGKGFAVVAEEVRNLAARSAGAAKETTDMIEGSIKKAESGTKIARDTAEELSQLVSGIEKVAQLVGNIAIASNEQASGIAQINQGIMQVSQVIQTNSATSEESAAASEELSSQAGMLKEMVSRFTLKQGNNGFGKFDEFSPAVLRMLETMGEKMPKEPARDSHDSQGAWSKIALSDNEFGKY